MRNEAGYLPYRFREAAVLLVLCLLAAAADLSVSILSPKSYSETAREAEELRTEISPGMRTGGAGSADRHQGNRTGDHARRCRRRNSGPAGGDSCGSRERDRHGGSRYG